MFKFSSRTTAVTKGRRLPCLLPVLTALEKFLPFRGSSYGSSEIGMDFSNSPLYKKEKMDHEPTDKICPPKLFNALQEGISTGADSLSVWLSSILVAFEVRRF